MCALRRKLAFFECTDYFDNLEQRGGGRGALYRTSEATGELTILLRAGRNFYRLDILRRILRQDNHESPA